MSATARSASAAGRMPSAPYPGLRPFQPHEEVLLFGRERQVQQVIERLSQTQLVTVIGGSGSGKSSLVLAGVLPELRAFGIPGTGDYWVPMVCTPGTNASQADREQGLNTPITRLARKFAALLEPLASAEEDEARVAQIAERLREDLGFAQLVDLYSGQLKRRQGPDPKEARFLLVIDQFEEIFHPTTHQSQDARMLVERVIDHFFSPHPRCYIVLTMRSEHLNDCAGFLKLPDAINKSSYLVRRLDDYELRDVITLPAQQLLRLKTAASADRSRLPAELAFDPPVTQRLLRDVRAISDDPDHLPLLQHVLARTWQAASHRVKDRLDMPERVGLEDLAIAAQGHAPGGLPDGLNVLRASVAHWAEAAYLRHNPEAQGQLERLLPRLGVRDPNTGMYSQQRVEVEDFAKLLGPGKTGADLKALVADGFLGEVNYLFWDEEKPDPGRPQGAAAAAGYRPPTTLKVSHESLIRGWERLRRVIDQQAERFEEFVELLRKCERWSRAGRPEGQLLESSDLLRAAAAQLDPVLANPDQRQAWFARLGATAANDALVAQQGAVRAYLDASQARQKAIVAREGRRRRLMLALGLGALLLVPPAVYFTLIQGPQFERSQDLLQSNIRTARYVPFRQPGVGSQQTALVGLLNAAEQIYLAREGRSTFTQRASQRLMSVLVHLPYFADRASLFNQVAAVSESTVNARLRNLLVSSVWLMPSWPDSKAMGLPEVTDGVTCGKDGSDKPRIGRLFKWTYKNEKGDSISRWFFVQQRDDDGREREPQLYAVRVDRNTQTCEPMQTLRPSVGFERSVNPELAFDHGGRYFWMIDNTASPKAATLFEIDTVLQDLQERRRARLEGRVQIYKDQDVEALHKAFAANAAAASSPASAPKAALLTTLSTKAGRAMKVGSTGWRLVDASAQPTPKSDIPFFSRTLKPATAGSPCAKLVESLWEKSDPGIEKAFGLEEDTPPAAHCFMVTMRKEEATFLVSISLRVFASPGHTDKGDPAHNEDKANLAFIPRFSRAVAQKGEDKVPDGVWTLGTRRYDGWIQGQFSDLYGVPYFASMPWSTCALYKLGHEVLGSEPSPQVCRTSP